MSNYNKSIKNRIHKSQKILFEKIANIDINKYNISDYNKNYINSKLNGLHSVLGLYGNLIFLTMKDSQIPLEKFTLVDYGGGSGIMSYLASEIGIGTVIYNDIYDVSCADAKILSEKLELQINHFVCGDIDDLIKYVAKRKITINGMASYDVIEHIYDIELYFKKLSSLSKTRFNIAFGSGANIKNPLFVRHVTKKQLEFENVNRDKGWGHKERDSLKSYFEIRKEIISKHSSDLSNDEIIKLAKETRGLIKHDILNCIDQYIKNGKINYRISHPTNTCDPITGNWAEHMMDQKWLKTMIKSYNFKVDIVPGYFYMNGKSYKSIIKSFINFFIALFGKRGMIFSPYYIVKGFFNHN